MNAKLVWQCAADNAPLLLQWLVLCGAIWIGYLGYATDPDAIAAIDAIRERYDAPPEPRRSARLARRRTGK